jgi:hypothetical protein
MSNGVIMRGDVWTSLAGLSELFQACQAYPVLPLRLAAALAAARYTGSNVLIAFIT